MTIQHKTLKCAECGSGYLETTGLNQYRCAHCGSVSVVEDNVSQRLDRVLDQVKDAAAQRLAAEQAAKAAQLGPQRRAVLLAFGLLAAFGLLFPLGLNLWIKAQAGDRAGSVAEVERERDIPTDKLRFDGARQVLMGSGTSARPKLFVVAHNETGRVLDSPRITAEFFNGDTRLGEQSARLTSLLLMPGESQGILFDLPNSGSVTRQTFKVDRLGEPYRTIDTPKLVFAQARLVQEESEVRVVGRIANPLPQASLGSVNVQVTAYDESGLPIAVGDGSVRSTPLRPGDRGTVEVRLQFFGGKTPIASWDYRIDHAVVDAEGTRMEAVSADRVVRVTGAPESFDPALRLSTEDLLADASERFDLKQLELLPLIPGVNNIRQRTYMTELINRSTDRIAVTPTAVISRYDGHTLDGKTTVGGIAYIYPGERIPVQVDPDRADDISQTRVEWKPLRSAPLPGTRTPLEVKVTSTEAKIGNVTVNFSQRFSYKAAEVQGVVKNPGTSIVRKTKLWVSLRDKTGKLTGFSIVNDLPAIGAGDSVPFKVIITQQGANFTTVTTAYQSAE